METWRQGWIYLRRWLGLVETQPSGDLSGSLGDRGEQIAADYLRRQGCIILARNVRMGRGEIDLVAVEGRTVVFVEVKTRRSHRFGLPVEAVTPAKQRQLVRLALIYLKRHRLLNHSVRFDVVAITWGEEQLPEVCHIRHAFESDLKYQFYA